MTDDKQNYCLTSDYKGYSLSRGTIRPEHLLANSLDLLQDIVHSIIEEKTPPISIVQTSATHGLTKREIVETKQCVQQILSIYTALEELEHRARSIDHNMSLSQLHVEMHSVLLDTWLDVADALNYLAPHGTSFGTHPSDSTDYGFWEVEH